MHETLAGVVIFYTLVAITLVGAAWVAFARNIVHSAFALLGTFFGMAGLYAFLAADFLAVIQLLVYVGGILVLILFAVMLTAKLDNLKVSNPSVGIVPGLCLLVVVAGTMAYLAIRGFGAQSPTAPAQPTTAAIGNALLGDYVLPFEVISILLLAVLLGAVTLARGQQPGDEE
jgi:NADH:ubiquinone oxidoreductase subunit 6 (subunit J)